MPITTFTGSLTSNQLQRADQRMKMRSVKERRANENTKAKLKKSNRIDLTNPTPPKA